MHCVMVQVATDLSTEPICLLNNYAFYINCWFLLESVTVLTAGCQNETKYVFI